MRCPWEIRSIFFSLDRNLRFLLLSKGPDKEQDGPHGDARIGKIEGRKVPVPTIEVNVDEVTNLAVGVTARRWPENIVVQVAERSGEDQKQSSGKPGAAFLGPCDHHRQAQHGYDPQTNQDVWGVCKLAKGRPGILDAHERKPAHALAEDVVARMPTDVANQVRLDFSQKGKDARLTPQVNSDQERHEAEPPDQNGRFWPIIQRFRP
ncbi:MAG: hypothetical protein ACI8X5_000405 [Planctomycetota bacterium]|jgi:hypothetical protein